MKHLHAHAQHAWRMATRGLVLAAGVALLATAPAHSQTWPEKPIRIVVPYAVGGSTEVTARLIGKARATRLGQPVVVENRTGAGGAIGHEVAAKSPADGYTLLFSAAGPLVVTPHTYPKLGYDPVKGFDPVMLVAVQPLLLIANPSLKINTVEDLVREARARQGKLNYGSFGNGSAAHLAGESFKTHAKVDMTHVPYKGSAPALTALVAGEVDVMFDVFSTAATQVQGGRARAIAITSRERSPIFPNVPTMAEAGYPAFEAGTWFGVLVPAGTPKAVINKLNETLNAVMGEKEVRNVLQSQGAILKGGSPAEFAEFFASEYDKMGKLVKTAGVKVDCPTTRQPSESRAPGSPTAPPSTPPRRTAGRG